MVHPPAHPRQSKATVRARATPRARATVDLPREPWLESGQDDQGRWRNRYAYNGKTWADIERQGGPSKWVTLSACTVLRAAYR